MNPEITKIIEQYLGGELSVADQAVFEARMETNQALKNEVEFQKSIHEAAKRANLRTKVATIGKSYHFLKNLKWGGIGLGVLLAASLGTMAVVKQLSSTQELSLSELTSLTKQLEKDAAIDNLKSEFFAWNANDTAFLSKEGVLISVPENALLLNDKPYNNPAVVQFQEALDGASIVKAGLSTTSNGNLLETQGMFSFSAATKDGKQLTINPKVGIYVQVPVDEYKEGMQLFDGEKDVNGNINWVKPRALEKIPIPVDMAKLDFYPPSYETKLNDLKARKIKDYRDSLYLSFEGDIEQEQIQQTGFSTTNLSNNVNTFPTKTPRVKDLSYQENIQWRSKVEYLPNDEIYITLTATLKNGWKIFSSKHNPSKADYTGIPTEFRLTSVWNLQPTEELKDGSTPKKEINELGESMVFEKKAVFKQKFKKYSKNSFWYTFDVSYQICNEEGCIYPPDMHVNIKIEGESNMKDGKQNIPPSSVLGFWNKKFNNPLLATREFENRMQEIHRTCDKSVLDLYLQNLNKPMHELDQKVVEKGYTKFQQFADQHVGALNPNNPHLKGLSEFYENAIAELQKREKNLREKDQKKKQDWDEKVSSERWKESSRTSERENQVFCEEYTFNHKNVRKQLGYVLGATIYGNRPISNIDRFVYATTKARKTAEFTDPTTGKTARIQYNEFSFSVNDAKKYNKLFAYVFPDKLNSYHRLDGKDGKFSFPLNDEITYDLAIVGVNESGYSYVQRMTLKGGELGELSLEKVSETKLDASIRQLNSKRGVKAFDVKEELKWLETEQKNYVEQKRRANDQKFRNELKPVVFPCNCGVPMEADTLEVTSGSPN